MYRCTSMALSGGPYVIISLQVEPCARQHMHPIAYLRGFSSFYLSCTRHSARVGPQDLDSKPRIPAMMLWLEAVYGFTSAYRNNIETVVRAGNVFLVCLYRGGLRLSAVMQRSLSWTKPSNLVQRISAYVSAKHAFRMQALKTAKIHDFAKNSRRWRLRFGDEATNSTQVGTEPSVVRLHTGRRFCFKPFWLVSL